MIDLYFASPTTRDHTTSQGILTAISNSPMELLDGRRGKMATKFLYTLAIAGEPIPLGTVTIPWCSADVYRAYKVLKDEFLERTKRFQFHAQGGVKPDMLERMFADPRLRVRLKHNRDPDKRDWLRYLRAYASSMSLAEADATAAELREMTTILRKSEEDFRVVFGFAPPPAMLEVLVKRTNGDDGASGMGTRPPRPS